MTEILTNKNPIKTFTEKLDQTLMLRGINSNIRNVVYSLQTAMKAYGAEGLRISVTVDDIIVEQIKEDE